jgi:hypothetical protein
MSRTAMTNFPQLPTRRRAPSTGGGRGRSIHPSPTVRNPRIRLRDTWPPARPYVTNARNAGDVLDQAQAGVHGLCVRLDGA